MATLVGQRVFGIALGYEDLIDHDQLRHDPVMAVLAGKLAARRADCAPLAGKSTLNRLELSRPEPTRYHKIGYDAAAIEGLFVDLFLDAHRAPPPQIILDLDATDDPLHGHQEGPLLPRLLRLLLLSAALRVLRPASAGGQAAPGQHRRQRRRVEEMARIVAQIRARWPQVRILLRADSGFAREALMAWCEDNGVDFLFGLAKNARLDRRDRGRTRRGRKSRANAPASRRAASRTSPGRRSTAGAASAGSSPRPNGPAARPIRALSSPRWRARSTRPATSTRSSTAPAARWKTASRNASSTCSADRTSAKTMRANQLRLWFASMAYVLVCALRRIGLAPHPVRPRHLRHDPPQAAEDRRAGAHQRAPHQARHALGLSLSGRVPRRPRRARRRDGLTNQKAPAKITPANHPGDHCPQRDSQKLKSIGSTHNHPSLHWLSHRARHRRLENQPGMRNPG